MTPDTTVLVLVDLQEKLVRAMHQPEALLRAAEILVRGAGVLGVPVLVTEQNPDGLGPTVAPVADALPPERIAKRSFSACGEAAFRTALEAVGGQTVLLAGVETHVCIYQTARDLAADGYAVEVVADAVSSRTPGNKAIGLEKARAAGAGATSVETALFELLGAADGDRFKALLRLVK